MIRSSRQRRLALLSVGFAVLPLLFALIRAVSANYDLRMLWMAFASFVGATLVMRVGGARKRRPKVVIALDMLKPFEGHNTIEYTLDPKGKFTRVTWSMHGRQPYIGKVMSIFMDCDKMIGKDFEAGLANLKALTERQKGEST